MTTASATVDIERPIRMVYNQWTQFEEFPQFMEGVELVVQSSDTTLHWAAEIGGVRREWDARITDQRPDEKVAWTSTSGSRNGGIVTFTALDPQRTSVSLELDFEPEGFVEHVGDILGFVSRRAEDNLVRFKEFIERRERETGSWRGEVDTEDAVELLIQDHRVVMVMFDQFEVSGDAAIAGRIWQALAEHTRIEEQLVYPVIRIKVDGGDRLVDQAVEEHRRVDELIDRARGQFEQGAQGAMREMRMVVEHHAGDEENDVLPKLRDALGADGLIELGRRMAQMKATDEAGASSR